MVHEMSVVELFGKVYIAVDDLVQYCQQLRTENRFLTIPAQAVFNTIERVCESSKTERIVEKDYSLNTYNDREVTRFLEAVRAKSEMDKFLGNNARSRKNR
jgi:hypothetical protein